MTSVAVLSKPPFSLKTLVKDSNCVLIQDPSAIWGGSDHLPRRNLLTYTEDFSNAAWIAALKNGTLTAGQAGVNGNNGTLYVETSGGGSTYRTLYQTGSITAAVGDKIVCYFDAKYYANRYLVVYPQSTNNLAYATFDLQNGTITATGGTQYFASSITPLGGGYYRCSVTISCAAAEAIKAAFYMQPTSGALAAYVGDGASGIYISQSGEHIASTTDQSYQRITDWVFEQYAWAAQKNVPWLRRNMLGYTESLDNKTQWPDQVGGTGVASVRTANYAAAPDGTTTACRVQLNAGSNGAGDYSGIRQLVTTNVGMTYTDSVFVKLTSGSTTVSVVFDDSGTGNKITVTDSWVEHKISNTASGTGRGLRVLLGAGYGTSATADLLLWHPSKSVGTCDYQRIATTWPVEYTSLAQAAGYPVSLYSDRAGTTATVGPDDPVGVLLDQKNTQTQAITNGSFTNGLAGWTDNSTGGGVASAETGALVLDRNDTVVDQVAQQITVPVDTYVQIRFTARSTSAGAGYLVAYLANTDTGTQNLFSCTTALVDTSYTWLIKTTAANPFLRLRNGFATSTATIDNVSVTLLPGYHAIAPSVAGSPTLRLDGNGKFYLDRDTTDDDLQITWPTNLTATGVIYTATGDYTTKDSGLTLSGLTSYKFPQRPSGDYGRIVMAAESRYDAKIIKYLDAKRGRSYQLGPELVSNGTFNTDTTGWTVTGASDWSWDAGRAKCVYSAGSQFSQAVTLTAGKTYLLSGVRENIPGVSVTFGLRTSGAVAASTNVSSVLPVVGTNTFFYTPPANATVYFGCLTYGGSGTVYFDNLSIREILI
jgi:hypothetical protein